MESASSPIRKTFVPTKDTDRSLISLRRNKTKAEKLYRENYDVVFAETVADKHRQILYSQGTLQPNALLLTFVESCLSISVPSKNELLGTRKNILLPQKYVNRAGNKFHVAYTRRITQFGVRINVLDNPICWNLLNVRRYFNFLTTYVHSYGPIMRKYL